MRQYGMRLAWMVGLGMAASSGIVLSSALHWAKACGPSEAESPCTAEDSDEMIDPMSVNATCYICHTTFVREPISKVHFQQKITCIKCHGLSADHANDEHIGATKPDVVYRRDQVDAMCGECHEKHNVSARKVVRRYIKRKISQLPVVCTDCHGMHWIESTEDSSGP